MSFHLYFQVFHINFKICFRHLALSERISFERIFKQSHRILQYDANNLGTKFLSNSEEKRKADRVYSGDLSYRGRLNIQLAMLHVIIDSLLIFQHFSIQTKQYSANETYIVRNCNTTMHLRCSVSFECFYILHVHEKLMG